MGRVKICGITNKRDALCASSLDAWALGFIFYKKSSRYISPQDAQNIIEALPKNVLSVGVFVDAQKEEIDAVIKDCRLKVVQFHGNETPLFCSQFKAVKTIKAIRIKSKEDLVKALKYKTDYLLFDTFQKDAFGGTGKVFDWEILKSSKLKGRKIVLSGGLNPKNIAGAISSVKAYAFDASSGVERRPGKKCQRLLKKFFSEVNIKNKQ
ncbi:MAG: phosphoribosylanthranilate isomerase [Candidatus Omnitrophica bacterium]|nr:phosphoribosylanthranilate isomerase [Candidatus Omnitrophota bacterium]